VQQIPAALDESLGDGEEVRALAGQFSPEAVQLYYQIAILGRRDLPLAPEPRSGFEMVLLRMLAFRPVKVGTAGTAPLVATGTAKRAPVQQTPAVSASEPAPLQVAEPPAPQAVAPLADAMPAQSAIVGAMPSPGDAAGWASLVAKLPLTGMTRQMAEHCALKSYQGGKVILSLDPAFENLRNPKWEQGLQLAIGHYVGGEVRLGIDSEAPTASTPGQLRKEQQAANQQTAEQAIAEDEALQSILEHFDGTIQPGSVRPVE
jgi:DNA polymerase-3 subunit gamma/tau